MSFVSSAESTVHWVAGRGSEADRHGGCFSRQLPSPRGLLPAHATGDCCHWTAWGRRCWRHSQGLDHTRQRSTSCTWAKHRTRGLRPLPGAVQREAQASLAGGDGGGGGRCHHLLEGDGQGLTSQWTVGSAPPQVASAWSMY